jgi:hypothetical protein
VNPLVLGPNSPYKVPKTSLKRDCESFKSHKNAHTAEYAKACGHEASVTLAGSSAVAEARSLQEWVAHMRWFIGGTARVNGLHAARPAYKNLKPSLKCKKLILLFEKDRLVHNGKSDD